jgi:hypothetical protein
LWPLRASLLATFILAAALFPSVAAGYGWPLKPFNRPHPIRGSFGDPRYHLGAESELSSFHFGVDIAAPDGTAVYAVEPGYVHAYNSRLTVTTKRSREFGYWHVRPVIKTGRHVRSHQLIGRIIAGWGHVHFSESFRGAYKDPLRRRALTPFYDTTTPTVDTLRVVTDSGGLVDPQHVTGAVSVVIGASDAPPIAPPPPWDVARLAPAAVWWTLTGPSGVFTSNLVADFAVGIPPSSLYGWIYAPGTYQNKAHRPGNYLYWGARSFDTGGYPDGRYQLTVSARDDRGNIGTRTVDLQFANRVTGWSQFRPHTVVRSPQ